MGAVSKSVLLRNKIAKISHKSARRFGRVDKYGARFKVHLYTLMGFVCGFLMAFGTLLLYDRYLLQSDQLAHHTSGSAYLQTGYMLALQELAAEELDLARHLTQEVRILCLVLTTPAYHETRAAHVLATWGKRCNKLVFVSSAPDEELGAVAVVEAANDEYPNLWNKTREAFRYAYEQHFDEFDWFLKADDDTYVIVENLRYMLYGYTPDTPIYFGYKMIMKNVQYMSGGASYVLSKAALERFMNTAYHNDTLCPAPDPHKPEDFCMGICLHNIGILFGESRFTTSADNKTKYTPLDLSSFMDPEYNLTISPWVFERTPYVVTTGLDCCSNFSIAFHYTKPAHMYLYEYLIYNLQAFGLTKPLVKLPIKMLPDKVEEIFPRDTNNSIILLENREVVFRDINEINFTDT